MSLVLNNQALLFISKSNFGATGVGLLHSCRQVCPNSLGTGQLEVHRWPWDNLQDLTHFILETPKGVLAKSADPDQMPHNVASDLGLHYFASCSTIFQQKYLN